MKINIFSSWRFHALDLARELEKQGHDVLFYSFMTEQQCEQFGLKPECCKSFFKLCTPIFHLQRIFNSYPKLSEKLSNLEIAYLDFWASILMRKCDLFIGMSRISLKALKSAKRRGAVTLLERGSKHILEQARILEEIPSESKKTVPKENIKRELAGYKITDYVVIPSKHVEKSFTDRGFDKNRLFRNPYGVNLSTFFPTIKSAEINIYDVIMVGQWSYRKGADILTEACLNRLNVKLLHVGGILDCPLPQHERFFHVGMVPQHVLQKFYAQSKIFVLPSREEGLALVQVQALACGLPIVCSQHTGGWDLNQMLDDKKWIVEMQATTVDELVRCINEALTLYHTVPEGTLRNYASQSLEQLSWEAYGKRYNDFIEDLYS